MVLPNSPEKIYPPTTSANMRRFIKFPGTPICFKSAPNNMHNRKMTEYISSKEADEFKGGFCMY
jgi:hypothetical protein